MSLWHSLLEVAVRAPSPHNVQPWRVRLIDEHVADLFLEKARTLPEEDVTGSFLLLTMGLFLESLAILAAGRGLMLEHEPAHPPAWFAAANLATVHEEFLPFARLRLVPATGAVPAFTEAEFVARRTSRIRYTRESVPPPATAALTATARTFGHAYHALTEPERIERILALNTRAVFADLNARGYHDEIAGWFRYDDRTARRTRDGLDARCMAQPIADLWLAGHAPWLLRAPLLSRLFAARYRRQIGPVVTLGVLSGGFWDPAEAFLAGRVLIHFWLMATRHGLVLHPYGNLVTNHTASAAFAEDTGIANAWLVFKIGRSSPPPESYRRSLAEVLLD